MSSTAEKVITSRVLASIQSGCVVRAVRDADGQIQYPVSVTLSLTIPLSDMASLLGDRLIVLGVDGAPVAHAELRRWGVI